LHLIVAHPMGVRAEVLLNRAEGRCSFVADAEGGRRRMNKLNDAIETHWIQTAVEQGEQSALRGTYQVGRKLVEEWHLGSGLKARCLSAFEQSYKEALSRASLR
jgi:hypothetical protein